VSRYDWHRPNADWEPYTLSRAMNTLGHNLAIGGALFEAVRRARFRCPACGLEPCDGRHPGLVGPCCVCCPVPPVERTPETVTGADVPP
jgi:hypothetical protein